MKYSNYVKSALATAAIGFLALGLTSTPAGATTVPATFTVTATVAALCSMSASPLAFGGYTGAVSDNTATLSITCTNTTPYSVGLSAGASGGTVTTRAMKSILKSSTLNYALYSDSTHITNWGDTLATNWVTGAGSGSLVAVTVYGRIPAGQLAVPATDYTDTITATLTY